MRLNRYLATCGVGSRRKVEEHILSGRIKVNGRIVKSLSTNVEPATDTVLFDDSPLALPDRVYLALNKPEGVITSAKDEYGRPTVFNLLPPMNQRMFSVGRLDVDTSGLIIFMNDGELAHRLAHPSYELDKVYRVVIKGKLEHEAVKKLESGIWLSEGKTSPASVKVLRSTSEVSICEITIHEGFNRQIRRMFAKVGMKVKMLERITFGPITLDDLPVGKVRFLTNDEIESLKDAVAKRRKKGHRVRKRYNVIKGKKAGHGATGKSRNFRTQRRGGK